jgi:hypothetical protein
MIPKSQTFPPRAWGPRDWQRLGATSLVALTLGFCSFIPIEWWTDWLGLNIPIAILLLPGLILVAWSLFEEPSVDMDGRLLIFYPYTALAFTLIAVEDLVSALFWSLLMIPTLAVGAYFYLRTRSDKVRWVLLAVGILLLAAMGNPFGL